MHDQRSNVGNTPPLSSQAQLAALSSEQLAEAVGAATVTSTTTPRVVVVEASITSATYSLNYFILTSYLLAQV